MWPLAPRTASVAVGVLLAITLSGCCSTRPPEKFAVLISTEEADAPDTAENSEFWYDVVLTYRTLLHDGFRPENILVLYGNGKPFTSTQHSEYNVLSGAADGRVNRSNAIIPLEGENGLIVKDNICNALCCMAKGRPATQRNGTCSCPQTAESGGGFSCAAFEIPRPSSHDFLVVWVKGHGSAVGNDVNLGFPNSGDALTDKELRGILDQAAPRRSVLLFETCAAGGWLDDFTNGVLDRVLGRGTVALTAAGKPNGANRWNESSYPREYQETNNTSGLEPNEVWHGRFTFWVNAALRREDMTGTTVASDLDGNGIVSMGEAYRLTSTEIDQENRSLPDQLQQHPGISTRAGLSTCVFLSLSEPGWYCRPCCGGPPH